MDKWGKGQYPVSINTLESNQEVLLDYRIQTRGFGLLWTLPTDATTEDREDLSKFGINPYTMITTDDDVFLDHKTKDLSSEDLVFDSLNFTNVTALGYGKAPHDMRTYYEDFAEGAVKYGNVLEGDFAYLPEDATKMGAVEIFAAFNGSNDYQKVGEAQYTESGWQYSPQNGASVKNNRFVFPDNVTDFRLKTETKLAGLIYNVEPRVRLKPSAKVLSYVKQWREGAKNPEGMLTNEVGLNVESAHGDFGVNRSRGWNKLTAFRYGATVTKSGSYENDVRRQIVNLTYTGRYSLDTNVIEKKDLEMAKEKGLYEEKTSLVWYDLLPKGVVPNTRSIDVGKGAQVDQVELIENYKDSGRTLMKVYITRDPNWRVINWEDSLINEWGLRDTATITYKATYDWQYLHEFGRDLDNRLAVEAPGQDVGIVEGLIGEPDDPLAGNHENSKSAVSGVETLMKNLGTGSKTPSFLYAKDVKTLVVDTAATTSLRKRVDVNKEGQFGDGLLEEYAKNVYEGGFYQYQFALKNTEENKTKDMILYDSLENYVPTEDKEDFGDIQWKGTLERINVENLEQAGIKPVVYYSTKKGIKVDDTDDRADLDLTNRSIWSTQKPANAADITAFAIDMRKAKDGSDFVLEAEGALSFTIDMKAPLLTAEQKKTYYDEFLKAGESEAGEAGGAHAYNNTVLVNTNVSVKSGTATKDQLVRYDYVKVGLKPYRLEVQKKWDDDDNRDGIRPDSVTMHLVADGKRTGEKAVLNAENEWKATFDGLRYLNDLDTPIYYTVEEDPVEGYELRTKVTSREDGFFVEAVNYHEPERLEFEGTKRWENDTESTRGKGIKLSLYNGDKKLETFTVRPDGDGNWKYKINPFKYEKGQEIEYTLKEEYVPGYISKVDGLNITNTYDPFADLEFVKKVSNPTHKTKDVYFTFELSIEGEPSTVFNYETSSGRRGEISHGGQVDLKMDEKLTIKRLPSDKRILMREVDKPGYQLDGSASHMSGVLQAGKTGYFTAVNDYRGRGSVSLQFEKVLENRELGPYQFIFDVYNEEGRVIASGSNLKDGTVPFNRINYTEEDAGKTFNYVVKERQLGKPGYTYSQEELKVSVKVTDNGDGTMEAVPTYGKKVFTNKYEAKGDLELTAYKTFNSSRRVKDGEFEFELLRNGRRVKTARNDATGKVTFKGLPFTHKDIGKTFTFEAKELKGQDPNVIYDETKVQFTVKVFDNGDGTLGFEVVAKDLYVDDIKNDPSLPMFVNKEESGSLTISKEVVSKPVDRNKKFRFRIELEGENLPEGEVELKRTQLPGFE